MHLDQAKKSTHRKGRRKINIEFITDKSRRLITFSKRKAGIMKKAYELATLTGTQVLLLVASETGHVYTFATPKLQPLITKPEGKSFIQSCLNTPDEDNPQDFETMRPKLDKITEYGEAEYNMGPTYSTSPPHQHYNGGYGSYSPPPGYPPNGGEPPRHPYSSPGHYPPREQYDAYSEYPPEYRGEYGHGEFQGHPPEHYPSGRRLSYPGLGRGGPPNYPLQGSLHHPPGHSLPPPHPEHHQGPVHGGYHPDYSRDYPPPPQPDYHYAPMSHGPPPYDHYGGHPEYGDRPEMHHPMSGSFDGPLDQGIDMHQNGYLRQEHGSHDHKDEAYQGP